MVPPSSTGYTRAVVSGSGVNTPIAPRRHSHVGDTDKQSVDPVSSWLFCGGKGDAPQAAQVAGFKTCGLVIGTELLDGGETLWLRPD